MQIIEWLPGGYRALFTPGAKGVEKVAAQGGGPGQGGVGSPCQAAGNCSADHAQAVPQLLHFLEGLQVCK